MHRQTSIAAIVAAFERGDLAGARRLADTELASAKPSPALFHLAGLIECRLGLFESGVGLLRSAVTLDPANASYRIVLARALIDCGRPGEALDVAIPTSPSQVELWQVRAESAFAAGERGIEADAWRRLCGLHTTEPLLWMNLARALLALARFDEAEAAYRRALDVRPGLLAAYQELALTLERTNQLGELASLLDRSAAAGLDKESLAEAWALLEVRRKRPAEALRLLQKPPRDADRVRWNRLRARACDAVGDAAGAFAAATEMNRSVPQYSSARAAGATYRTHLAGLASTITPEWAANLRRLAH